MPKHNVNETWWNQLSIEWKYIFVYNIDFDLKEYFENREYSKHLRISIEDLDKTIFLGKYYLDDIIKKLENIDSLTIIQASSNKDLTALEPFLNLRELNYQSYYSQDYTDLSYINNLINLEKLELDVSYFDLNQISNLTNLKELNINGETNNLAQLSKFSNLTKLVLTIGDLNDWTDYSPFENLINLSCLEIKIEGNIKEFDFLSGLTKIEKLVLFIIKGEVDDFDAISNLINLKDLDIKILDAENRTKKIDYSFLKNLNRLEKLSLSKVTMTYIPYISLLNNLVELSIALIEDTISFPINLKNLKILRLRSNGKNLDIISLLPKLEDLSLIFYQTNELYSEVEETDLNHISHLTQLKKLKLSTYDCELDVLSNFKNLEVLDLSGYRGLNSYHRYSPGWGNTANLEPLKYLKNLKELNLYYNYSDIESLSKITSLEKLTLYDGNHEDEDEYDFNPMYHDSFYKNYHISSDFDKSINLSPISQLKNLKYLKISRNRSDLSPLMSLTNLKTLILPENVRCIAPIGKLKNLETLSVSTTKYDYSYREVIQLLTNLKSLRLSGYRIFLYPAFKSHNLSELSLHFHYIEPNDLLLIRNMNKFEFSISSMKEKLDYEFLLKVAKANKVIKYD